MRARRAFIAYMWLLLKPLIWNDAHVEKHDSESRLNAIPSAAAKRNERLFRRFRPARSRCKDESAESPWRQLFFTECGIDFPKELGDIAEEAKDMTNPTTPVRKKYTVSHAPRLREAAENRAVLLESRRKFRIKHVKENPELYDKSSYSDSGFLSDPNSDPNTYCDSDMVYGTDSCSE